MKTVALKGKKPGKPQPDKTAKEMAEMFKSLADWKRVQILRLLMREGRMNVTRICEELNNESQPAVSHHLTQLKHARLVDFERDGKFNHYFISSDAVRTLMNSVFPNATRAQQTINFGELEVTFKTK